MAEPEKTQDLGPEHGTAAPPSENPPPYQPSYGTTDNAPPPSYTPSADPADENNGPSIIMRPNDIEEPNGRPRGNARHDDQPPSYESIFGQVRAAKQESSSVVHFLKQFIIIILGTIGCTICVGLVLAIPISMIVMGVRYKDECPAEKYIPIYLIVGGVFGVVKNLLNIGQRTKNRQDNQDDENAKTNPIDGILNCFLMAWFIAGNVWIYRTYNDWSKDEEDPNYCNPTLYYYAFWITTATYIIMGTVCFCICCAGLVAACVGDSND